MSMKSILTREVNIGVATVTFVFRWPTTQKVVFGTHRPTFIIQKTTFKRNIIYHFCLRGHGNKSYNLIGSLSWVTENIPNSVAIRNEFVVANVSLNGLTRDLKTDFN